MADEHECQRAAVQCCAVQHQVADRVDDDEQPQGVGPPPEDGVAEAEGRRADGLGRRDPDVLAEDDVGEVAQAEQDPRGGRGTHGSHGGCCPEHDAAEPEFLVDGGGGVSDGEDCQRPGRGG